MVASRGMHWSLMRINIYKNTCFDKCINWLLDFHYDTPLKLTQGYTSDPKVIKSPMILKRK